MDRQGFRRTAAIWIILDVIHFLCLIALFFIVNFITHIQNLYCTFKLFMRETDM